MPNYTYFCASCDRYYEVFQSMKADPLENCNLCGEKVSRMIGAGAGIVFKGSGFYVTDYRKDSGKSGSEKANADGASPAGSEKKAEAPDSAAAKPKESSTPAKSSGSD